MSLLWHWAQVYSPIQFKFGNLFFEGLPSKSWYPIHILFIVCILFINTSPTHSCIVMCPIWIERSLTFGCLAQNVCIIAWIQSPYIISYGKHLIIIRSASPNDLFKSEASSFCTFTFIFPHLLLHLSGMPSLIFLDFFFFKILT